MILKSDPGSWQHKLIGQRKSFFQPVADLRPAEAHLAFKLQGARQSARPPPANQPGAPNTDQQDDPDSRWVNNLHQ